MGRVNSVHSMQVLAVHNTNKSKGGKVMTDQEVVTELVNIVTSEPFIRQSVAIDEVASRLNVGKSRVHRLLCSTDSIKRITSFTPYTLVTVEYADEHMTDKHAIAELQKVVDNSPFIEKFAAAENVAKKLRMCKVHVPLWWHV